MGRSSHRHEGGSVGGDAVVRDVYDIADAVSHGATHVEANDPDEIRRWNAKIRLEAIARVLRLHEVKTVQRLDQLLRRGREAG